jgi:hypothetical protein
MNNSIVKRRKDRFRGRVQEELMIVLGWSLPLIERFVRLMLIALILLSAVAALAGAAEETNAAIDRWSAAYSSNDPEAVVKTYRPDAILLGTVSPIMSEGTDAIRAYFAPQGNRQ